MPPAVGPVLPERGTNCNGSRSWAPAGQADNTGPAFLCLQGWGNQPTQKTADAANHKNITQPSPWFPSHDQYQGCTALKKNFGEACRSVGPALFLSRQASQGRPPQWFGEAQCFPSNIMPGKCQAHLCFCSSKQFLLTRLLHCGQCFHCLPVLFPKVLWRPHGEGNKPHAVSRATKLLAGTAGDFKASA